MIIINDNKTYNVEINNNITYNICDEYVPDTDHSYFYIEDASGLANTITFTKQNTYAPDVPLYTSTDMQNWIYYGVIPVGGINITIQPYTKLYVKSVCSGWNDEYLLNGKIYYFANYIGVSGSYNVGGNIMSLMRGNNFVNATFNNLNDNYFAFAYLLGKVGSRPFTSTIVNASNLILPSNTIKGCYTGLFNQCSTLVTSPELRATTLTENCYAGLFNFCGSLNEVTTYANDISATNCLHNWLQNVAATGTFHNLGNPAPTYPSGASGIPTGWTEVNN